MSSYKKDFPNCTDGFNWTSQILNILLLIFLLSVVIRMSVLNGGGFWTAGFFLPSYKET